MLNERAELEQYIGNQAECDRLTRLFFYKNRSGIPRALMIIARHYLFDVYKYDEKVDSKDKFVIRERTKHNLAAWCGFMIQPASDEYVDSVQINNDKIQDWLLSYLRLQPKNNTENEIASFIESRAPKWYVKEQKDIYQLVNHSFSVNAINLYTIIADAINRGPLQNKVLVLSRSFFKDFEFSCYKKYNYFLYIIAAYLLCLDDEPDNQVIPLNNVDLSNWMHNQTLGKGSSINNFLGGSENFIVYSNGNYCIKKEFLEAYNFQILDVGDAEKNIDDLYVFTGEKWITAIDIKRLKKGK